MEWLEPLHIFQLLNKSDYFDALRKYGKSLLSLGVYPNLPDVDAIKNAAYVGMYPAEKWAKPTTRACTIDKATGLSVQRARFANGVRS